MAPWSANFAWAWERCVDARRALHVRDSLMSRANAARKRWAAGTYLVHRVQALGEHREVVGQQHVIVVLEIRYEEKERSDQRSERTKSQINSDRPCEPAARCQR